MLLNKHGRYVRLQLTGDQSIQMREIEVYVPNNGTPDMHTTGNSIEITDGDTTPSLDDDTAFGSVLLNSSREKEYTISNNGTKSIFITGINIPGAEFKLAKEPTRQIAPGNSTTFSIAFTPTSVGSVSSDVSIMTEVASGGSFDFKIQGDGTNQSIPEIDVIGNMQSIPDGSANPTVANGTDFCSVDSSSAEITHTFTISNQGSGPLHLTGSPIVAISGANASDFTVTAQPPSSTIDSS
jgi:hypothetical protein